MKYSLAPVRATRLAGTIVLATKEQELFSAPLIWIWAIFGGSTQNYRLIPPRSHISAEQSQSLFFVTAELQWINPEALSFPPFWLWTWLAFASLSDLSKRSSQSTFIAGIVGYFWTYQLQYWSQMGSDESVNRSLGTIDN